MPSNNTLHNWLQSNRPTLGDHFIRWDCINSECMLVVFHNLFLWVFFLETCLSKLMHPLWTCVIQYYWIPANCRALYYVILTPALHPGRQTNYCGCFGEERKGKERKSIYIAPFRTKVLTKRSGMDHTVLPANNTMPETMRPSYFMSSFCSSLQFIWHLSTDVLKIFLHHVSDVKFEVVNFQAKNHCLRKLNASRQLTAAENRQWWLWRQENCFECQLLWNWLLQSKALWNGETVKIRWRSWKINYFFIALTLLVGCNEGILACKQYFSKPEDFLLVDL